MTRREGELGGYNSGRPEYGSPFTLPAPLPLSTYRTILHSQYIRLLVPNYELILLWVCHMFGSVFTPTAITLLLQVSSFSFIIATVSPGFADR